MIPWLEPSTPFPPIQSALKHPNGLLAAGGDLSPERLLEGYRRGIFPWFCEGDPILWWSPDPRMILYPEKLRISRSLAKTLRNRRYEVRFDSAFDEVMAGCAAPRGANPGPGSRARCSEPTGACIGSDTRTRSKPGSTESLREGSTALRSAGCFSANRCSPARATPPRSPSRLWLPTSSPWTS